MGTFGGSGDPTDHNMRPPNAARGKRVNRVEKCIVGEMREASMPDRTFDA